MSTDFIDSLLADIPAEEVRDERIGNYDDAVLVKDTEVNSSIREDGTVQYSIAAELKFQNEKGEHKAVAFIRVPEAGQTEDKANQFFKNNLLRWLHAFGILPLTNKNTPVLPQSDEETRRAFVDKVAAAFNTRVGETVGISVAQNKQGYVNINPGKAKVVKQ